MLEPARSVDTTIRRAARRAPAAMPRRALAAAAGLSLALLGSGGASALASPPPTGPLTSKCQAAWVGNPQPSQACAIVWWNASTREVSTRCTVEYGFDGVTTDVFECGLEQGKGQTFETLLADYAPGVTDSSTGGQVYTYETNELKPLMGHTYATKFVFQPSLGFASGETVTIETPFAPVCGEGLGVELSELPEATRGMPYTAELAACNGIPPYKWKKIGKLPNGLKLSKTGVLSGTPSAKKLAPGSYAFNVQVSDSNKGKTATTISLRIT